MVFAWFGGQCVATLLEVQGVRAKGWMVERGVGLVMALRWKRRNASREARYVAIVEEAACAAPRLD